MKANHLFILITLTICIGFSGCGNELASDEQFLLCGVADPLNELPWLSEQYENIKNVHESGIILYRYNSKEVVEVQSSLMSSTNLSQYYCDGTQLKFDTPDQSEYSDYLSERVKVKILYGIELWKNLH